MEKIILASGSPRRREMLEFLGIPFDVVVPDIDESIHDALPPPERVVALAEGKARAAAAAVDTGALGRLALGADTLVCVEGAGPPLVLGKPSGIDEARDMIERLGGKVHTVYTGVALLDRKDRRMRTALSASSVRFAEISPAELEEYLASGDWAGAAGAYRIQGRAAFFVERIEGSWSGIVGLPLRELYGMLHDANYRVPVPRPIADGAGIGKSPAGKA